MVTEMSQAENCRVSQKRSVKYDEAPKMATSGTQTEEVKRPRVEPAPATAKPTNNGWGDLFKDRQTFVDMHLC